MNKKSYDPKQRAVLELKALIREGEHQARRINRMVENLARINKAKAAVKEQLIKICGLK